MLTQSNPNLQELRYFRDEQPEYIKNSRILSAQRFKQHIYGMTLAQSLKDREFLNYLSKPNYERIEERKFEKEDIRHRMEQQAAERQRWVLDNFAKQKFQQ